MESRSRSQLKGASPNVRMEPKWPGKNNATISEFSTFLKLNKSRDQFLLRLTLFLPYLRLTVKIFQFLRLSTKFLAVLRLSVNPIETLYFIQRNELAYYLEQSPPPHQGCYPCQ